VPRALSPPYRAPRCARTPGRRPAPWAASSSSTPITGRGRAAQPAYPHAIGAQRAPARQSRVHTFTPTTAAATRRPFLADVQALTRSWYGDRRPSLPLDEVPVGGSAVRHYRSIAAPLLRTGERRPSSTRPGAVPRLLRQIRRNIVRDLRRAPVGDYAAAVGADAGVASRAAARPRAAPIFYVASEQQVGGGPPPPPPRRSRRLNRRATSTPLAEPCPTLGSGAAAVSRRPLEVAPLARAVNAARCGRREANRRHAETPGMGVVPGVFREEVRLVCPEEAGPLCGRSRRGMSDSAGSACAL